MTSRGVQESLPNRRRIVTYKVRVGGSASTYIRVGLYDDDRVGEIFVTQSLIGSFVRGMVDSAAVLASKALQYGMPFDELCDTFIGTQFDPSGLTDDPEIPQVTSILDYIGQRLRKDFVSAGANEGNNVSSEPVSSGGLHSIQTSLI